MCGTLSKLGSKIRRLRFLLEDGSNTTPKPIRGFVKQANRGEKRHWQSVWGGIFSIAAHRHVDIVRVRVAGHGTGNLT